MSRPAILAACTTAIGDTVLCTPALMALGRAFDVDVLVHQHRLPLLLGNTFVRHLYPYRNNPFNRTWLATKLWKRSYHRLVVLHANDDLVKLLPKLRYEMAANIQGWDDPSLSLKEVMVDRGLHVVQQRLVLARWAGAQTQEGDEAMRVFLSQRELEEAETWLCERGLPRERERVGMVLGASHIFKRWPPERFGRVARALVRQGAEVIVVGGPHEAYLAKLAQKEAGVRLRTGHNLGMRQLAAVLSRLDVLVTNDTGPLHLGQAVGTPVLGLFGPTDPVTIGPVRYDLHRVIKVPATCSPCLTKTCPDPVCLEAIQEKNVLDAVLDMLAQPELRLEKRSCM
ncbi:MAG: glycosyltransferase family 9 protein [Desulfarculus sp.]|nr:glycosyltransferase family 9 protein [Desulfarculus sp.]